ncbi:hypothetical protein CBS63078_9758 [Aspergillus niger]|nr:hypothetical protein CBS13152_10886 [Aspergillus niger]KAI2891230.1 hypothetical protein CBS63078_9758 [Aspergillus niger]KAI2930085.1 hypothetical protein CBS147321_10647 [Aspergillus niger]KAI2958100.1 hypothetical protein CBS147324_10609 [Aspergillus niger]KAI3016747.1 hypothetical protein CBS147347_10677 [Aspergillus niger]
MYNLVGFPALLCLVLAVAPVLSAPVAAGDGAIVRRQSHHLNTNTQSGSNMGFSIPDGPSFNSGQYASNRFREDRGGDDDDEGSSESSNTNAGNGMNIGIPGGPSINMGNYFSNNYEETEEVHDDPSTSAS